MNFNIFFPPSSLYRRADFFALYLCTAGYYSSYYLSELQSPHVLWRNKAARHSQKWKQQRECQFPPIGSEGSFFSCGQKIRLMSNLRSNEFKCAEASLGESENALNSLQRSSKISVSTYFSSPTIPRYRYIWSVQLLVIFLLVSSQPRVTLRLPGVSIRIH